MSELTITSTTDSAEDVREAVSQVAEVEPTEEEISAPEAHEETHESESAADEHTGEQPRRKNTGFQKRLNVLTRRNYELLEKIKQLETARPTTPTTTTTTENTPRRESLQELASRLERETAQVQQARQEQQRTPETRTQQPEVQQQQPVSAELQILQDTYNQKERAAQAKYSDWKEVVGRCNLRLPNLIAEKILGLENATDVVYHLASNPQQIMELVKAGPEGSLLQLGRISARLEKQEAAARRPISNAPAPINPIRGSGHRAEPDISDDSIDYKDFKRLREPQEKRWRSGVR